MPLLQAHGQRDIDGGGVMTGIHEENPAWEDLIFVLREIRDHLETISERM